MPKSRKKSDPSFDAATQAKMFTIVDQELAHEVVPRKVHFGLGPVLVLGLDPADGHPEFPAWWFLSGHGRTLPITDEGLFAHWGRYHAAHASLREDYRRLLFGLFSQSSQVGYDVAQGRFLRRSRSTE